MPFDVTAKVAKAATADRQLSIRFHAGGWMQRGQTMTARTSWTLKKGETRASTKLLVPRYEDWQLCGWEAVVDGQADDEISLDRGEYPGMGMGGEVTVIASNKLSQSIEPMISAMMSGNSISMLPT